MLVRLFAIMVAFAMLVLIVSLLKTSSLLPSTPAAHIKPDLKLAIFLPPAAAPATQPTPLHASQFGGYHTTTLTHVIYILRNQLEANALLQAITEHWPAYPPCDNWDEIFPCASSPAFPTQPNKPNLLILVAASIDASTLGETVRMSPHVAKCFHRPGKIIRYSFEPTMYSLEELLLLGDCGVANFAQEVGYAMFVPAFSRPMQANWLSHVAKSVVFPVPLYWVILPFQHRFPIAEKNTVAIYRLSTHPNANSGGSREFRCKPINSTTYYEVGNLTAATTFPQVFFSHIRVHSRNVLREKWTGVSAFSIQDQLHCFLYYFYRTEYELVRMQLVSRVLITELFTSREEQAVPGVTQLVGLNATRLPPPGLRKKSQSIPSPHHDSWLSHVVFALPNVPSQFDRLKHTLTEWWPKFPPCRSEEDYTFLAQWQSNTCFATDVKKPTLVFMVSRRSFLELEAEAAMYDLKLEQKIQREIVQVLQQTSTRCFSAVKICVVRFHQNVDNYITGSKVLFERFLQGECTGGKEQGDHALYIEPDARPVQAGWLSSLSSTVVYPNPPSWIIGAIFRGAESITKIPSYPKSWFFHFNGNGIYQLSRTRSKISSPPQPLPEDLKGMESFRSHYFARVRPWAISTAFWETAMDMDIMDYIFGVFHVVVNHMEWALGEAGVAKLRAQGKPIEQSSPPRYREHLPNVVSRFITHSRYSDMIANKYRSDWTFEEMAANGAQIVHGGFCGEACK